MQEFSSVTASSYDADSLAPLLSEKSADGWDVISIVSAGTNIVAYLSRDVPDDGEDTGEIDSSAFAADDTVAAEAVVAEAQIAEAELIEEIVADETAEAAIDAEIATDIEDVAAIEAFEESIVVPSDPTPTSAEPAPVDEPAGWGAAPDERPEETSIESLAAQVSEPEPAQPVVAEPVVAEPVAAVAQPAISEPAPVESTVPAGWYADPSGRYELRYWDGSAWTEHVSRAGQQFTDPPVA
jgi:hypothetical protein